MSALLKAAPPSHQDVAATIPTITATDQHQVQQQEGQRQQDGADGSSSFSSTPFGSVNVHDSPLDNDLVRIAIENFDAFEPEKNRKGSSGEHSGCSSPASEDSGFPSPQPFPSSNLASSLVYEVQMTELETGITHEMKDIMVMSGSPTNLVLCGEDLKFRSAKVFRGNSADQIICKELGPSFAGQDVDVFRGAVRMRYRDIVLHPTPPDHPQMAIF